MFLIASNAVSACGWAWSPERAEPVESKLSKWYAGDAAHYSGEAHHQLFALPPALMERLGV